MMYATSILFFASLYASNTFYPFFAPIHLLLVSEKFVRMVIDISVHKKCLEGLQ
jgi:hypothetical protein